MNGINHFIFAINLCLIFLGISSSNLVFIILFSLMFGVLLDIDHLFNRSSQWYHKRTWVQEPVGFVLIGIPLAFAISMLDRIFLSLVLIPYASHIVLDYLCIFETYPFAPFSKVKKREGLGIFIPDDLFIRSKNSKMWSKRVKIKNIEGISENYFTIFNLILLFSILVFKY